MVVHAIAKTEIQAIERVFSIANEVVKEPARQRKHRAPLHLSSALPPRTTAAQRRRQKRLQRRRIKQQFLRCKDFVIAARCANRRRKRNGVDERGDMPAEPACRDDAIAQRCARTTAQPGLTPLISRPTCAGRSVSVCRSCPRIPSASSSAAPVSAALSHCTSPPLAPPPE